MKCMFLNNFFELKFSVKSDVDLYEIRLKLYVFVKSWNGILCCEKLFSKNILKPKNRWKNNLRIKFLSLVLKLFFDKVFGDLDQFISLIHYHHQQIVKSPEKLFLCLV